MKSSQRLTLYLVSAAIMIASVAAAFYSVSISKKPVLASVAVSRADVTRLVNVTGEVKADVDVDLAFERGGSVSRVAAKVGDKVLAGQIVVSLGAADVAAQLTQAEAAQAAAEARLASVKRGARNEDVAVQDAGVRAAQGSVTESRTGLVDKLQSAFAAADDAVRGKADQLFTEPTGASPRFSFFIPDQRLSDDLGWQRYLIEKRLADWQTRNVALTAGADLDAAVIATKTDLDYVKTFLDGVVGAVDKVNASSNPTLAPGAIDGYKVNLSMARTNVLAVQSALTVGLEKLHGANAALDIVSSQKTLKVAAPAIEDVAVQEAAVQQAAAAVDAVRVQLGKTSLRAPFAGVVTRMDAKTGATVTPGVPLVTVMGDGTYEIEALVPEADIADVKVGEDSAVTLDAYGTGVPFTASVALIDPAQSTVNGASGYKVTLRFRDADERIKPGMTANAAIIAGTRTNALVVPRSAVISRDGQAFVLVMDGNGTEQRKVTLGLRGADTVEVTGGLKEGEHIANFGN